MTPREAAIELEQAIGQAIVRYEKACPSGICVGIFIDRQPDGFKVRPRLKTRQPTADERTTPPNPADTPPFNNKEATRR